MASQKQPHRSLRKLDTMPSPNHVGDGRHSVQRTGENVHSSVLDSLLPISPQVSKITSSGPIKHNALLSI